MNLDEALTDPPAVSDRWRNADEALRLSWIAEFIASEELADALVPVSAGTDGQVTFRLEQPMSAQERGGFLLDVEARLKNRVDVGITLWCEPVGDKSKLRQLRGVQILAKE